MKARICFLTGLAISLAISNPTWGFDEKQMLEAEDASLLGNAFKVSDTEASGGYSIRLTEGIQKIT